MGNSYIEDFDNFLSKIRNVSCDAILFTDKAVCFYPIILHAQGLKEVKKRLGKRQGKPYPSGNLMKMVELNLDHKYFKFSENFFQQFLEQKKNKQNKTKKKLPQNLWFHLD